MEKEFNLNERRKRLFKGLEKKWSLYDGTNFKELGDVFKIIKNQDKEFIRQLKENKVCAHCKSNPCMCGQSDWVVGLDTLLELAGDKLN